MTDITRDDDHEWYRRGDEKYPPVSTILNELETDTTGLEIWRGRNDGDGDNPYWQHLFWYARHRGTIGHFECLDPLAERDLVSSDEAGSMKQILVGPDENEFDDDDVPLCMDEIVYSVMVNHHYDYASMKSQFDGNTRLIDVLDDDVEYITDEFGELQDKLGIDQIAVEAYLVHPEHEYGGQCDLLYEDASGDTVIADLKTSSSLRHKHRLQSIAYKRAVEDADIIDIDSIDRIEIIRLNPDKHHVVVHGSELPDHVDAEAEWYDTDEFYEDAWGNFSYEDQDEMFAQFRELLKRYHNRDNSDD
jgi:hypothetical protein